MDLTKHEPTVDVDILNRAYRYAVGTLLVPHYGTNPSVFPIFSEIYDEYCELWVREMNEATDKQLFGNFKKINLDEYTVENGFNPEDFGIDPVSKLSEYLVEQGYSFQHEGHNVNLPLQSIW